MGAIVPGPVRPYYPEDAINQQYRYADFLQNQRPATSWAGVVAQGLGGLGSGLMRGSAQNALTSNQDMRSKAIRDAMAAPDTLTMAKALSNAGVPGLDEKAMGLMVQDRETQSNRAYQDRRDAANRAAQMQIHAADRAAQLESQKALFEYQKRLQMELKQEEQRQQMDLIKQIRGSQNLDDPNPVGSPVASDPSNPNAVFADELLGGMHRSPSTEDKAATALALGSKDKAIDILNEKGKLTEGQTKDAAWAERLLRAEADMNAAAPVDASGKFTKYDPAAAANVAWPNDGVLGQLGNSNEWKSYHRAGKEALAVILRKDSGGAITAEEWRDYGPIYLPQPSDPPAVILEKRRARIAIARGLRSGSGEAFDRMFPKFNDMMRQRLMAMGADLSQAPASTEKADKKMSQTFETDADIPEGAKVKDDKGRVLVKKNGALIPIESLNAVENEGLMGGGAGSAPWGG